MEMNLSQNIPSDSERTVSEKLVGVEYEHLQADAESKALIPSLKMVPNIETQSETGNMQGNAPLDVPPVSVCLPSNLTDRIFRLQRELRKMVDAYIKDLKAKCTVAKKKKVQGKMASPEACRRDPESSEVKISSLEATDAVPKEVKVDVPEAPSPIPSGELIDAVPLRYKRPDSDEVLPMRNPLGEAVQLPMCSLRNPEEPSSDSKEAKKKKRNSCIRFERMKVDFILPSHADISGMDLDNLVSPIAQLNQAPRSTRQFSFTERLLKWELEVREREGGKFDMYYYHGTEGYFRSIPEVTKYMMYEEYPGGKQSCKRRSRSGHQFEVISLEQGSSSQPAAKRMLDEKSTETLEAKVEVKRKRGRPRRSDQQTEVQGSSSKAAVRRRRKTSSEQQGDHEEATAAAAPKRRKKSQPLPHNEAGTRLDGVIAETSESKGHEAAPDIEVMLDETMTRLRNSGFTPEGDTPPEDRDEEDKMLDEAIESLRKRGLAAQAKNSSASSELVGDQAAAPSDTPRDER